MSLSLALPPSAALLSSSRPVQLAQLHPVALASILDSHLRRQPDHDRVFGTLLGVRRSASSSSSTDEAAVSPSTVQVTDAYAVPYAVRSHGGQVTIDVEHHRAVLDLHLKANPRLVVVGWFATHPTLNSFSALIHQFYSTECTTTAAGQNAASGSGQQAVHLALDPDSLEFTCYTASPIGGQASNANGQEAHFAFVPIPSTVVVPAQERPSLDLLTERLSSLSALVPDAATAATLSSAQSDANPATPLETLYSLLRQVTAMLDQVLAYVEKVTRGEIQGDEKIGRALLETVGTVPTRAANAGSGVAASEEQGGEVEEAAVEKKKSSKSGGARSADAAAVQQVDFEEEFNAHLADVLMVRSLLVSL